MVYVQNNKPIKEYLHPYYTEFGITVSAMISVNSGMTAETSTTQSSLVTNQIAKQR